jgi:hypothetical protein
MKRKSFDWELCVQYIPMSNNVELSRWLVFGQQGSNVLFDSRDRSQKVVVKASVNTRLDICITTAPGTTLQRGAVTRKALGCILLNLPL